MTHLRLDKISKSFGGVHAVVDVSLDAPKGAITGLIGPNGAGKTTVVNMITGVLKVNGGKIFVDGVDVTEAPMEEIARAGVARTFQNIRLLPEASVLENVMIGFYRTDPSAILAQVLGLPSARAAHRSAREKAMALLDRFGMRRYADYLASALAYGHQRRVEIMRAIAAEPEVLLLDEPVAGMNDVEARALGDLFVGLAQGGMSILLIEHNMRFVTSFCSTIYVLDYGKIIASGPTTDVVADPAVIRAYLGG